MVKFDHISVIFIGYLRQFFTNQILVNHALDWSLNLHCWICLRMTFWNQFAMAVRLMQNTVRWRSDWFWYTCRRSWRNNYLDGNWYDLEGRFGYINRSEFGWGTKVYVRLSPTAIASVTIWPGGPNKYLPKFSGLCTRTDRSHLAVFCIDRNAIGCYDFIQMDKWELWLSFVYLSTPGWQCLAGLISWVHSMEDTHLIFGAESVL